MRSPLKYPGGKSKVIAASAVLDGRRIPVSLLIPPHHTYTERCAGGLSFLLNMPRCEAEIVNDLDVNLINFWRCVQRHPADLMETLKAATYSESEFIAARDYFDACPPWSLRVDVDRAARYMIRNRMSRGGYGKDFGWSTRERGKRRQGGARPGDLNAWETSIPLIGRAARRLVGVRFTSVLAHQHIPEILADPDAFVYLDPPYPKSTRNAKEVYAYEMTDVQHAEMLRGVVSATAKVMISGYRCDLYDTMLAGWRVASIVLPNAAGQNKVKESRTEILWMNY